MPFSVWQFTFTAQGNYRCKVRGEEQTLLIAAQGAAVRRGSAATRERDTRRIAQRSEAKCDRRPESARAPGCIRRRRDGDGRRRMVFHPKPYSPYRRADDASQGERATEGRRCARAERRKRLVQPWAVPPPQRNAPLRKGVERETDAPEGNLMIVERCIRERQHLFSCRE